MDQYTPLGENQSSTPSSTQTIEYENTLRRLKESPLHSLCLSNPPLGFTDSPSLSTLLSIDVTNGIKK